MGRFFGRKKEGAGFSLLELLIVLVLLGLVAAVSAPATGRFLKTIAARKKSNEIMATLRYARLLAVSKGVPVNLTVNKDGNALKLSGPVNETRTFDFGEGEKLTLEPPLVSFYPEGIASVGRLTYQSDQRREQIDIDPLTALPRLAAPVDTDTE